MSGTRMVGRRTRLALSVITATAAAAGALVAVAPAASAATCSYSFPADAAGSTRADLQTLMNTGASNCPNAGDQVIVTLTSNLTMDSTALTWASGPLADLTLQGSVTITGDGANRILYAGSQPGVVVTIDGLTMTGGGEADYGAAVYSSGMDLVIRDATFSANHVSGSGAYGGAVGSDNISASLTVTDSTFTGNGDPDDQGGALYWEGDVTITDSTFTSNQAGEGGAIWHSTGDLTITGSTFTSNNAVDTDGGAVSARATSTVTISSSTFTNNTSDDGGGAVSVLGTTTISDSTFTGNSTYYQGGAVESYGPLTVTDSTFSSNYTTTWGSYGRGGAIRIQNASSVLTITGSTIRDNSANWGGGLSLSNSATAVNVLNSTITGNSATTAGGGIYEDVEVDLTLDFVSLVSNTSASGANIALFDSDAIVTVRGSVFANPLGGGDNCANLGSPWTVVESVLDDSSCGAGFTSTTWAEMALGALANNGGPTQTMMPGEASVLVGFVADPSATAVTSVDQRGYSRTGAYTAGAVQWNASAPEPDLSQLPPSWYQAYQRSSADEVCLPGWDPSWAEWANDFTGGWTCERTVRWDIREDGWVEEPGFRAVADKA